MVRVSRPTMSATRQEPELVVAPKLLRHAPFARTLLAARWINFATGLGRLLDSRKSGAAARRTDNFCLGFCWPRSSHKLILKSFSSPISRCRYGWALQSVLPAAVQLRS